MSINFPPMLYNKTFARFLKDTFCIFTKFFYYFFTPPRRPCRRGIDRGERGQQEGAERLHIHAESDGCCGQRPCAHPAAPGAHGKQEEQCAACRAEAHVQCSPAPARCTPYRAEHIIRKPEQCAAKQEGKQLQRLPFNALSHVSRRTGATTACLSVRSRRSSVPAPCRAPRADRSPDRCARCAAPRRAQ